MTSSGGGGDGAGMMALMGQGTPMPGLPVAGKDSTIGDPMEYGRFQNFLPEIQAEGQNPMATGLRPDMFKYRSPTGILAEDGNSGGSGGGSSAEIQELRDALAQLQAGQGQGSDTGGFPRYDDPNAAAKFMGGGGGGVGAPQTMGMGGRGGMNRFGWDQSPPSPRVRPGDNPDPIAAAAAEAAAKMSGG